MGGDSEFSKLVRERKLAELAKKDQALRYLVGLAFSSLGPRSSAGLCLALT